MAYYNQWAPYVPVWKRQRNAAQEMKKLKKAGQTITPVVIIGRTIATTFWGKAWCNNLESYSDYENRLPRGRTYVRNGSVVDLQISKGTINAHVSGSELYEAKISINPVNMELWQSICTDCAGEIDSLVELLQGKLSKGVMARICAQKTGLFPKPSEIRFHCNCPDSAGMCKHLAAVLYGVGARLDHQPELLFRLRGVNEMDLIANVSKTLPLKTHAAKGKIIDADELGDIFGLDMAQGDAEPAKIAVKPKAKRAAVKKAAKKTAKKKATKKKAAKKMPVGKKAAGR